MKIESPDEEKSSTREVLIGETKPSPVEGLFNFGDDGECFLAAFRGGEVARSLHEPFGGGDAQNCQYEMYLLRSCSLPFFFETDLFTAVVSSKGLHLKSFLYPPHVTFRL